MGNENNSDSPPKMDEILKTLIPKTPKGKPLEIETYLLEREAQRRRLSWPLRLAQIHRKMGIRSDVTDLVDAILQRVLKRKWREHSLPERVKALIQKALPEAAEIYNAVKEVGFSGYLTEQDKKWQEAALKRFDTDKSSFSYIKREYLEDNTLYQLNGGQERRDFLGRLLKTVVFQNGFGKYGAQELYEKVKEMETD